VDRLPEWYQSGLPKPEQRGKELECRDHYAKKRQDIKTKHDEKAPYPRAFLRL